MPLTTDSRSADLVDPGPACHGVVAMKTSREDVETLVARIEQLERDRDRSTRDLAEALQRQASLQAQLDAAQATIAENAQIAAKQAATIGKLRRKLRDD